MTTYSTTATTDLLRAEKEHGITLADELQSAIAGALEQFIGAPDLAYFAMADDLLPALLEEFTNVDLNNYVTEEKTAPEAGTSETEEEQIPNHSDHHPIVTAHLLHGRDTKNHTWKTSSGRTLPMGDYLPILMPVPFLHALTPTRMMLSPDDVCAHDDFLIKKFKEHQAKKREERRQCITRDVEEEFFREQLDALDDQTSKIYEKIDAQVEDIINRLDSQERGLM